MLLCQTISRILIVKVVDLIEFSWCFSRLLLFCQVTVACRKDPTIYNYEGEQGCRFAE